MNINDKAFALPNFNPDDHPEFVIDQKMHITRHGTEEKNPGKYIVQCDYGMLPIFIDKANISNGHRVIRRTTGIELVAGETQHNDVYLILLSQETLEACALAVKMTVDEILASGIPAPAG